MSLLAGIEAQPILMDRIERYRVRHKIATLGEAIERLIRLSLFLDILPDRSTLIRRDGLTAEWRPPAKPASERANSPPWDRGEPASDQDDVLF